MQSREEYGGPANSFLAEATRAFHAGRLDEALMLARQALDLSPALVQAEVLVGVVKARRGDIAGAEELLGAVLRREPSCYEATVSLATVYRETQRFDEAAALGLKAVSLRPTEAQSHYEFGQTWFRAGDLQKSSVAFQRAVQLNPKFAPAQEGLAKVYLAQGNRVAAVQALEHATRRAPRPETLIQLAELYLKERDYAKAEAAARQARLSAPTTVGGLAVLATALLRQEKSDEARAVLVEAAQLPESGAAAFQLAVAQRFAGLLEGAERSLRVAIAHDPSKVAPYAVLVHNIKVQESDRPLVEAMTGLVDKADLSMADRISLRFGLGKAYEDLGEYVEAMEHYDEANRLSHLDKLKGQSYDRKTHSSGIDSLMKVVSAQQVSIGLPGGSTSEAPIFVFGMIRSGTTLAEQILSRHPHVEAAGEQPFWLSRWGEAVTDDTLDPNRLASLGHEYVGQLTGVQGSKPRFTDKMPGNAMLAGLIHLALPNARLIHMRRVPIDNAISIWTTPNAGVSDGGYEKSTLAFVFREYLRLMDYWRATLPADRFLDVDYEALVANPEPQIRRMLEFCGLEWDEACLSPEKNERAVLTPSLWQVRQPIYRSSVDRYRRFEGSLGELGELLSLSHPRVARAGDAGG